ncbi:MAG: hypothetical protein WC214_04425 [Candidatus Omnitrophota bacterium]
MKCNNYFSVAGINILVVSSKQYQINEKSDWRYQNFLLKKEPKKIDLKIDLRIKEDYVRYNPEILFETRREKVNPKGKALCRNRLRELRMRQEINEQRKKKEDYLGSELGWRISEIGNKYLLEGGAAGNFQAYFDKKFQKIKIDVISDKNEWKLADVFTGFLQLFLIYYLSYTKQGIVVHSTAIKDKPNKGKGYLFAGVSGAGKSTTSKIWDKNSPGVIILNDDRIILRKIKNKFYIYSTPWHGDFSDYLKNSTEHASLDKLFFIYHKKTNKAEKVPHREFFNLFYQSLFVPFWDKENLNFVSEFMMELMEKVPCYKFGFKNNKKIIEYVRNI